MNSSLAEKLKNLPNLPGVYLFRNRDRKIIYVGKAKNLKNRVGSYFHLSLEAGTKTAALVSRINDVEWVEVESEFDALILEAELIKKYRPKYNVVQKDDKTYLYIVIRNESLSVNTEKILLPKIITMRRTELLPNDVKFGPYPDGTTARFIVRTLRKLFPYRDCSVSKFQNYHRKGRPCIYGQLKICPAPCVNYNAQDIKDYKRNIQNTKKILLGGSSKVTSELNKKMNKFAREKNYEEAAKYRDLVSKYNYVRQKYKLPEVYMESPTLMDDIALRSLNELVKQVPVILSLPKRIECYDISNISGKEAVGSMVVAVDGKITKKEYKRFRIKYKHSPDDFEMIYEVIQRRASHHPYVTNDKKSEWPVPDLLLVDGGKGQVSAALAALAEMGVKIPVVGLAKKEETIVYKDVNDFIELWLDKTNPGLNLLIRLRDEAHRFAQDYHHKLRTKSLLL